MQFKLRSWDLNDLESLVKHANNYNIAKNLTNQFPHPYTKENGEAFITMAIKSDPLTIFAIEINGQAAGGIGLHLQQDIHCKNAELGGFKTFEIDRIFARPFGNNLGSQKVLTKSGFILEGKFEKTIYKFGEYQDELIYAVRK